MSPMIPRGFESECFGPGVGQSIWKPTLTALMFWSMAAFLYQEVTHSDRSILSRLDLALRRMGSQDRKKGEQEEAA